MASAPALREPVIPADYHFHEGNCHLQLRNYNEAFSCFQRALEVDETHAQAHNNLAFLFHMAKRYQDAWLHLHAAKGNGEQVNPQFAEALVQAMSQDQE